jgi:hypothetical protein
MHRRAVRLGVLALLLASGAAAAYLLWDGDMRLRAVEGRRETLDAVLDRVLPAAADVVAAQKAYADYGLRDEATFARVSERLQQIRSDAARLRSSDQSGSATAQLEEVWASVALLTTAERQAREQLASGEPLAAADLLLGSSPQQHATMVAAGLRGFRDAELRAVQTERDRLIGRTRVLLATVAALWTFGLVALVRAPRSSDVRSTTTAPAPAEPPSAPYGAVTTVTAEAERPREFDRASLRAAQDALPGNPVPAESVPHQTSPTIDLEATAALCDSIARLSDTGSLTGILELAARLLDARGIIIWMGAGEELFAAAAFGYDAAVMERMRPIARTADNATAATWRTGQPRTVAAEGRGLGAIVAPMCGPTDCLGVLAAEVRAGRETDSGTRAVAAILAAQLAGVLAAWPAASSSAAAGSHTAHDRARDGGGSDRQSATS